MATMEDALKLTLTQGLTEETRRVQELKDTDVENMWHVLDGGERYLLAAIRVGVYSTLLRKFTKGDSFETVMKYVAREALDGARWPHNSRSLLDRLSHQLRTSVYAELVAYFS